MAQTKTPDPIDWATLGDPIEHKPSSTVGSITVDVLKTVPEPIRKRAEASLTVNTAQVAKKANSTASRSRVVYRWDIQPVANDAMGEAFGKLLVKYAKFRPSEGDIPHADPKTAAGQATARHGAPTWFSKLDDGDYIACGKTDAGAFLGVRFSVRPHEQRRDAARVPGTV